MLPPLPPSPPEGPPRGTLSSRRIAFDPSPPSPALTSIVASSMNCTAVVRNRAPAARGQLRYRAPRVRRDDLGPRRRRGGGPAGPAGVGRDRGGRGHGLRRDRHAA